MKLEATTVTEIEIIEKAVTKEVIQITLDRKQLTYLALIVGSTSLSQRKSFVTESKYSHNRDIYSCVNTLRSDELAVLDDELVKVVYFDAIEMLGAKKE